MLYANVLSNVQMEIITEVLNIIGNHINEKHENFEDPTFEKYVPLFPNVNQQIYVTLHLNSQNDSKTTEELWLQSLADLPPMLFECTYAFICGQFLNNTEGNIITKILFLFEKYLDINSAAANHVLTLVLYKLGNVTNPDAHYVILQFIPKIGTYKENRHLVLTTLQSLSNYSIPLRCLTLDLLYNLWSLEPNYFHYLQNELLLDDEYDNTEVHITKANIFKMLCANKLVLHFIFLKDTCSYSLIYTYLQIS